MAIWLKAFALIQLGPRVGTLRAMVRPFAALADARWRTAGAVGSAARGLWRRGDLQPEDLVVVDLLAEALVRLGRLVRPCEGRAVVRSLQGAPKHIRQELELLVKLAARPDGQPSLVEKVVTSTVEEHVQEEVPGLSRASTDPHHNPLRDHARPFGEGPRGNL